MAVDPERLDELFAAAVAEPDGSARAAYLDQACAGYPELRERLNALLAAHEAANSFLQLPADASTVVYDALSERPGTTIGPYKLLQQIGEGGMGVVFMAEQSQPIQRTVALKIIKPGMDTRQVIARFEAERQALALMDHPNIARVLDAGTTDSGRPYFVMELVKGMPITKYCDDHHLAPRERLELFLPVCQAVQHAHQKGIIHRDLKPSNVLIALYDGHPIPKVIDFGVAKATGSKLTDRTMFTEFGAILGTLEYMSPEQAELNQLDVDTRADVYSLGVLLYELLTGTTPLERKRMKAAALDEVLRVIREVEPPKPSTRLSTTEGLLSIAANRGTEATKLSGLIRGELDWIVMKALEKDRNRRYETANGFAADVQRYLHDEAVQACPPSAAYRFRKFVRRNKAAVLIAVSLTGLLITAVVILAVSNIQIRRALAEKDYAIVTASTAADSMLFRVAYDKLAGVPNAEALRISLMREAIDYYNTLLRQDPKSTYLRHQLGGVLNVLSSLYRSIGKYQEAIKFAEQSIEIQQQLASEYPHNPDLWEELAVEENGLAYVWQIAPPGPNDEQMKVHYQRAYDIALKVSTEWPDRIPPMTTSLRYFAESALKSGDRPKAERFWNQAIEWGENVLNRDPPKPQQSPFKVRQFPDDKFPHADRLEDGVYVSNLWVAMPHGERQGVCWAIIGLGTLLTDENRYDEAEAVLQNGMRHVDVLFAENSPLSAQLKQSPVILLQNTRGVAASMNHRLAALYSRTGKVDKAVPLFEQAVSGIESLCVDYPKNRGYWITARWFHEQFVNALVSAGRKDQAKQVASQMHLWVKKLAPDVPSEPEARNELLQTQLQLVTLLRSTGQDREVVALLHQAIHECQSLGSEATPVMQLSIELATQIDRLASTGQEQEANDLARMAAEFGRRVTVQTSVTSEVPGESPKLRLLLTTLALLANNQQETKQIEADRQSFRQAAEHYLDVNNSAAYSDRLAMATHFRLIGSRLANTPNKDGQVADIHQSFMRLLRGVLKDSDCPNESRIEIGHVLRMWAYSLPWDAQHSAGVEEAFREAVSVLESVTDRRPDDIEAWALLADTHNGLGHLHERIGGAAVAEPEYRRSVEIFDEHAAIFDAHPIPDSNRAQCYFKLAELLAHTDRKPAAEPYYRRGVAIMESFVKLDASNPAGYNQLAWILATCPVPELRNPARATELAQRAVELAPASQHYWTTLGTARYRGGDWNGAIEALNKSLKLGPVNQAYAWFVLAMAHWQLHHRDDASSWRNKGVEWMEKNQAKSEMIHRIRAEMEELMKEESDIKNRESATTPN